jgi:hypothetical protein
VGLLAVGGRLHAVDPGAGASEPASHAHH